MWNIKTNLIIIICLCFHLSCRKSEMPRTALSYTKEMAGNHKWVGTIYNYRDSSLHDTTFDALVYAFDDTTVAFDKTLRPDIDFLKYIKNDNINACNIYTYYRVRYINPTQAISDTIKYYYKINKITYISYYPIENILNVHTP